jgi:hypothetical protein
MNLPPDSHTPEYLALSRIDLFANPSYARPNQAEDAQNDKGLQEKDEGTK